MPLSSMTHDLWPLPPVGTTFVAGFESTYLPIFGRDSLDLTYHSDLWQQDLDSVAASGVRHLRYPLQWQQIERVPGEYDWTHADRTLGYFRDHELVPIVDLVHHTSYPDWLVGGFADPRFGHAFLGFAEAVAQRYPWLPAYTLFNEPFATLFLAGHEGLWPPYDTGVRGFVGLLRSVLPALSNVASCWRELLPAAHHVWVDTAEHHVGSGQHAEYARLANDRRHVVLDLAIGHDIDPNRPFLRQLIEAGGEDLLTLRPLRVDVLGLDYYAHSEWFYDDKGGQAPPPYPVGLAAIAGEYADRYDLPLMLTETNIRGLPTDRVSWLRYTLEQYELALSRGVRLHGYCWFPQVDSSDWDSLLARAGGRVDPVGIVSRDAGSRRRETCFTAIWQTAAKGLPAAELPAYRWQSPCTAQLAGFAGATDHWRWQDPPPAEQVAAVLAELDDQNSDSPPNPNLLASDTPQQIVSPFEYAEEPILMFSHADHPDLVVLSHLRWSWVWQRPQHLISRLTQERSASGARTWFVEEPMFGDVAEPTLKSQCVDGITRVWLVLPALGRDHHQHVGFTAVEGRCYGQLLVRFLNEAQCVANPDVWLYSPMALELAEQLTPGRLIYDVMDDLAAFDHAPDGLRLLQRRALSEADIVFTGGRSLYKSVRAHRRHDVHLFPSGVDTRHYSQAQQLRRARTTRVAGYVGVIDERIDLPLIHALSAALPDWTIRMVGPVAKINPAGLPAAPNIEYPGFVTYDQLPAVMAGFDVALMPFALNAATKSISPTKTLEYLAAGLPVVSTRVADVVADYGDVVQLADDALSFASACRNAVGVEDPTFQRKLCPLLRRHEWDTIAETMSGLVERCAPWSRSSALAKESGR